MTSHLLLKLGHLWPLAGSTGASCSAILMVPASEVFLTIAEVAERQTR